MANHPADEVMVQLHFAKDPRFKRGRERAWPTSHFAIQARVTCCASTAVLSTKVSALLALISSSNVVRLVSWSALSTKTPEARPQAVS